MLTSWIDGWEPLCALVRQWTGWHNWAYVPDSRTLLFRGARRHGEDLDLNRSAYAALRVRHPFVLPVDFGEHSLERSPDGGCVWALRGEGLEFLIPVEHAACFEAPMSAPANAYHPDRQRPVDEFFHLLTFEESFPPRTLERLEQLAGCTLEWAGFTVGHREFGLLATWPGREPRELWFERAAYVDLPLRMDHAVLRPATAAENRAVRPHLPHSVACSTFEERWGVEPDGVTGWAKLWEHLVVEGDQGVGRVFADGVSVRVPRPEEPSFSQVASRPMGPGAPALDRLWPG